MAEINEWWVLLLATPGGVVLVKKALQLLRKPDRLSLQNEYQDILTKYLETNRNRIKELAVAQETIRELHRGIHQKELEIAERDREIQRLRTDHGAPDRGQPRDDSPYRANPPEIRDTTSNSEDPGRGAEGA